VFGLVQCLLF